MLLLHPSRRRSLCAFGRPYAGRRLMGNKFSDIQITKVMPEHRVFFMGLKESKAIQVPSELQLAFHKYAKQNLRSFPWRQPSISPYHLLLAELLLAQTKAHDVATVWPTLINRYPTPERLARANVSSLSSLLRRLGLQNQRAKALRLLARHLVEEYQGQLPSTVLELLSLPHVGLYTATAVSSFAFGKHVPIVDANVLRVFARIFGLPEQRELRRSQKVWAIGWALLPNRRVAQHNYALLDFAAQVCTPRAPRCDACHIRRCCAYGITKPGTDRSP